MIDPIDKPMLDMMMIIAAAEIVRLRCSIYCGQRDRYWDYDSPIFIKGDRVTHDILERLMIDVDTCFWEDFYNEAAEDIY